MFEAERDKARHIWRENARKVELNEAEERERRADIEGEEYVRFLGEKLLKVKESQVKHEVEVREMKNKTNKAL